MLYDTRWDKPEALSIEGLIAWLKQMPADGVYDYWNWNNCLAAQYNRFIGRQYNYETASRRLPNRGFDLQIEKIAECKPWTFGAALERARASS